MKRILLVLCLSVVLQCRQDRCDLDDFSCSDLAWGFLYARVTTPRFLYVSNNIAGGTVVGFSINPISGALTSLSQSFSSGGTNPTGLAVDAQGQYLYVGNSNPLLVSMSINASTGALSSVSSNATGLTLVSSIATDPTGRFVFTGNNSGASNVVAAFVSSSGVLAANGTASTTVTQPRRIAMDPLGRFLYAGMASNATNSAPISASGTLGTFLNESPPTGAGREELVADRTGSFLYTIDNNTPASGLRTATINATSGQLTAIATTSMATASQSIVLEKTGTYLYTGGSAAASVHEYQIGSNGVPVALTPATITLSANPVRLITEPSGRFVFAALTGGTIATLRIQTGGQLSLTSSISCSCTPDSLAVASYADYYLNPAW